MRDSRTVGVGRIIVIAIGVIGTVFPFYWLFVLATQSSSSSLGRPSLFYSPDFSAFGAVLQDGEFIHAAGMSVATVALTVLLSLAVTVPAAFIAVRRRPRGTEGLVVWLLICYLLPDFLIAIPLYALFQSLGLYDTAPGLAIAYQVFMAPLSMWLLLRFFADVPAEIAEAATLDGCSDFSALIRIYLPLVGPGIATTAVLVATTVWNEVTIALALTLNNPTIPIAVASYRGYASIQWNSLAAASLLAALPVVLFAVFAQRFIVRGLTAGFGK